MYTGTWGEGHIWSTSEWALFVTSKTWTAVQHFTDRFLDVLGLQRVPWPLPAAKEMPNLTLEHQRLKSILGCFCPCPLFWPLEGFIISLKFQKQRRSRSSIIKFVLYQMKTKYVLGGSSPLYCESHFVILAYLRCRLFGSILAPMILIYFDRIGSVEYGSFYLVLGLYSRQQVLLI